MSSKFVLSKKQNSEQTYEFDRLQFNRDEHSFFSSINSVLSQIKKKTLRIFYK